MGKRISQLDLANPLSASDTFPVVQGNRTKRATLEMVQSLTDDACECTLVSRYTTVGTDANTLKKFLYTYTLPEGIMNVDGNYLEIHAAGLFAANGNNKLVSVAIKQNSTSHYTTFSIPNGAYNDDYWLIDLRVQRSGSTTYTATSYYSVTGNAVSLQTPAVLHSVGDLTGIDWDAGDVQITVEGTNGTASANDITCGSFIIEAHLLDPNS